MYLNFVQRAELCFYVKGSRFINIFIVRIVCEDVPLVEFMHLVFARMPGESYRRRLRSLLLCESYVFRVLINSLVC